MEIIIRAEKPSERGVCDDILRQTYNGDAGANLAAAIRSTAEFNQNLSLVADNGGEILGYALYARVTVSGTAIVPAASLAVMGVRPAHQKIGVGERLVRHGLERCRGLRIDLVFATALPQYLARIGFQPAVPLGLKPNWEVSDELFTVFDLSGSRLGKVSGTVTYPGPFLGR